MMEFSLSGRDHFQEVCRKTTSTLNLLEYANKNRHLNYFNDFVIFSGNYRFPSNRMVLSCFSPFFEKMFKVEMKEKYQSSVELSCVDSDSIKNLIEFIYTGSIKINSDNVCNLLSASDYLQMENLKQFCFDFLCGSVTPQTCCVIVNISDLYRNNVLMAKATKAIKENFDIASSTTEFKLFTKEIMITLISQSDFELIKETSKYTAILGWTKHDENSRLSELHSLLQLLNLQQIPHEFIRDVILKEELVMQNNELCKLFLCIQTLHLDELKLAKHKTKILSLGGLKSQFNVTEVFSMFKSSRVTYPDLPEARSGGSSAVLLDQVYYVGGNDAQLETTKTVWSLSLKEKDRLKWKEVASINNRRAFFGIAVLNNCLVIVGGNNDDDDLASGEMYCPILNVWKSISPLNHRRQGNAVVSCKGRFYCIGGLKDTEGYEDDDEEENDDEEAYDDEEEEEYDDDEEACSEAEREQCAAAESDGGVKYLSSVECLFSVAGEWKEVKSMQTSRGYFAAVCYDGFIYVIGGESNIGRSLKSAEKYDPITNEWSYISDMNFKRSSCSACVLRGNIFVIGGEGENNQSIKEIECYNPLIDQWTIVGTVKANIFDHAVIAI